VTGRSRGFSLIEVIISLVIFSAVILGLAGLAFQVAKRSTRATDQALVMSLLLSKVDKASTVPFDSLPVIAVCDTSYSGVVQIRGCTTLQTVSVRVTQIQVIVTTSVPGARPDTITWRRSRRPVPIPLR
jgi:prepilin-type N-terminal cleavage/methylation domain-containing protein